MAQSLKKIHFLVDGLRALLEEVDREGYALAAIHVQTAIDLLLEEEGKEHSDEISEASPPGPQ